MTNLTQLRPLQADTLLKEYVAIRYEMGGTERIVALTEWATRVDRLYRTDLIATPAAQR